LTPAVFYVDNSLNRFSPNKHPKPLMRPFTEGFFFQAISPLGFTPPPHPILGNDGPKGLRGLVFPSLFFFCFEKTRYLNPLPLTIILFFIYLPTFEQDVLHSTPSGIIHFFTHTIIVIVAPLHPLVPYRSGAPRQVCSWRTPHIREMLPVPPHIVHDRSFLSAREMIVGRRKNPTRFFLSPPLPAKPLLTFPLFPPTLHNLFQKNKLSGTRDPQYV